jgi:transporter family protein
VKQHWEWFRSWPDISGIPQVLLLYASANPPSLLKALILPGQSFLHLIRFVMWWLYALLSALFASLTAITAKMGIAGVNSNLATAIRTLVVLLVAWMIVLTRGEAKGISTLSKQNLVFLVVSGICTGLSWIFYFKALQVGKVSQVAPVDKLSLALTILLSVVILGEALTLKTALGALLIIAGSLVLIL